MQKKFSDSRDNFPFDELSTRWIIIGTRFVPTFMENMEVCCQSESNKFFRKFQFDLSFSLQTKRKLVQDENSDQSCHVEASNSETLRSSSRWRFERFHQNVSRAVNMNIAKLIDVLVGLRRCETKTTKFQQTSMTLSTCGVLSQSPAFRWINGLAFLTKITVTKTERSW